jgi:simple sugar transport system permease protein
VDLSVGSVVAIAGAVSAVLLQGGHSLAVALAGALGAGLLAGAINGTLVARLGVQPIVATLILMVAGRGVAQLVVDGQVIIIKSPAFAYLANGFLLGLPFAPLLVAALYGAAHLALRRTALGLFLEAVGDNGTASRFAGLAAARIKAGAYVFCGGCAGLAGVLAAANIRAADAYRAGENLELDAIFAVVVGGTALAGGRFTILGSAVGALLIQTLTTTMYNLGVPPAVAPVPKALLIIGVSLLQSEKISRWLGGLGRRKPA